MTKPCTIRFSKEELALIDDYVKQQNEYRSVVLRKLIIDTIVCLYPQNHPLLNALGLKPPPSEESTTSEDSLLLSPKRQEEGLPQETQSVLDSEIPCFCRFEHNGLLWCAKSAPKTAKLATLKICGACPKRITKERIRQENLLLQTRYYVTCGAKEYHDPKKGLMLYCTKFYQGQYVTPKDCQTAKCLDIKEVKGQW